VFINLGGLTLDTAQQADALAADINRLLDGVRGPVKTIVCLDDFECHEQAAPRFFEMVRGRERAGGRPWARYATHAFVRRRLAAAFGQAGLPGQMYDSFDHAAAALKHDEQVPLPG
jgi:hypothetical protein